MKKNKLSIDLQGYITLAYLSAVVVGMIFDYQYYIHFGINIFEYSDILDFLLAPVKNLELIFFVLGSFLIVYILFKLDKLWLTRFPKSYRKLNFGITKEKIEPYRKIAFMFSIIVYLMLAAKLYGNLKFDQHEASPPQITIKFSQSNESIKGDYIGKNTDYIFIKEGKLLIKAIPIQSDVKEIILRE